MNDAEYLVQSPNRKSILYFFRRGLTAIYALSFVFQVISASSDGLETHSCRLLGYDGTSMATPVVAGAAAPVRVLSYRSLRCTVTVQELCVGALLPQTFAALSLCLAPSLRELVLLSATFGGYFAVHYPADLSRSPRKDQINIHDSLLEIYCSKNDSPTSAWGGLLYTCCSIV